MNLYNSCHKCGCVQTHVINVGVSKLIPLTPQKLETLPVNLKYDKQTQKEPAPTGDGKSECGKYTQ